MFDCATCPVSVKNVILDGNGTSPEKFLESLISTDRNGPIKESIVPPADVSTQNRTAHELTSASLESMGPMQNTASSFHSIKLEHDSSHDAVVEPIA